jgi:type II secretory pathway pseudopilin PulG
MKTRVIIALAVLVVLAASSPHFVKRAREKVLIRNCQHQLQSLGTFLRTYRTENNGRLPSDFGSMNSVDKQLLAPILICPGSGHAPGGFTNINSWADYIFVDWLAVLGRNTVPGDYPIAYDRSMSNHCGRGVNVLSVDGIVRWDSNAEWLKTFAAEHPEAKLPLPE